ncbi:hypothetical protein IF188_15225 [Microbacterium sp. NEAU-LLC]|uniref:MacB-like periplasmic core domain-containing protein n=1 Tax=Microbacterium helvum TaxID=2773713 RepID=A0ABR8NVF8_9MICO|nr:hypothetical protein [Microbacterium helvum]MBD3943046.1 hypothetical protein [Microbacterium helvum]
MPTMTIALLVAVACLATLLTVGRTTAAEAQLLARLESSGARLISAQDTSGAGLIHPATVAIIDASSVVERTVALSLPVDARPAAQGGGGTRVPLWEARGDLGSAVELVSGRMPGPGEAIISTHQAHAVGLDAAVGALEAGDRQWGIVGTFRARTAFDELDAGVLAPAAATTTTPQLYVIARTAADVPAAADLVREVIAPSGPGDLAVAAPDALAALQGALSRDLGGLGHSLLLLILGGGLCSSRSSRSPTHWCGATTWAGAAPSACLATHWSRSSSFAPASPRSPAG